VPSKGDKDRGEKETTSQRQKVSTKEKKWGEKCRKKTITKASPWKKKLSEYSQPLHKKPDLCNLKRKNKLLGKKRK